MSEPPQLDATRRAAVQTLLTGTSTVAEVAARFGVPASTVEAWRDAAFIAALEGAFPVPPPSSTSPRPPELALLLLSGKATGQTCPLGDEPVTIGRSPDCTICLQDPTLGRRHALIQRRGEKLILVDCASPQGTFVNGQRIARPHVLMLGDKLFVGRSVLQVVRAGETLADLEEPRDPLTGAYKREPFLQRLRAAFATAVREGRPLGLAVLEIDGFASLDEQHGRSTTDGILRELPLTVALPLLRHHDTLARLQDDRFAVLLPDTTLADACELCERLRLRVANHPFDKAGRDSFVEVTVSIGVAAVPHVDVPTVEALLGRADRALADARKNRKGPPAPRL